MLRLKAVWTILLSFISIPLFSQISFLPYQVYYTGSNPQVVAIGDLNNDGLNDIALGTGFYFDSINDFKVFIYYQNNLGNLTSPVVYSYPNGGGIKAISIGDVNNDSLMDLIIGYDDSIGIFYQNLSGALDSLVSYYSGNDVDCIRTGDLNNDSRTDIAVSHWNSPYIKIFYQDTIGFHTYNYTSPQAGRDEIEIGDLNNDGLNDLVFMPGQLITGIRVYYQNLAGTLNGYVIYNQPSSMPISMYGIAVGDLNNDGRNDVVGTGLGYNKIAIWFQDTITGLLQTPIDTVTYMNPEAVEIGDLNNDGKNEIILINAGWLNASVYEQDSSGTYGEYQMFPIPFSSHCLPQGLSIGDINNDGKKDIAIASFDGSTATGLILLKNNSYIQSVENVVLNRDELNAFPNPFLSSVVINLSGNTTDREVTLKIYDSKGMLLISETTRNSSIQLNLETLVSGVYVIAAEYDSKRVFRKLVKF